MRRGLALFLLYGTILNANEVVEYQKNNLHAFLTEKNEIGFSLGISKINDTIDVFNIKEQELGKERENLSSIGDMDGFDLNLGYTFNEKIYLNTNLNFKNIDYAGATLKNQKLDIYLRYQLYQNSDIAFAIDGGYTINKAKDTYMRELSTINDGLRNVISGKDISIRENGEGLYSLRYQEDNGVVKSLDLKEKPYIATINTKDETFYTRGIASFKKENWLFDAYLGYSETEIDNETDSSILHEKNKRLEEELKDINFVQNRTDTMFFTGLSFNYTLNSDWAIESSYQYNLINRIDSLDKKNHNHIFKLFSLYNINSNFLLYLGGTLMSNQFNGELPYLYQEYSENSFRHKYGFLNFGLKYKLE